MPSIEVGAPVNNGNLILRQRQCGRKLLSCLVGMACAKIWSFDPTIRVQVGFSSPIFTETRTASGQAQT